MEIDERVLRCYIEYHPVLVVSRDLGVQLRAATKATLSGQHAGFRPNDICRIHRVRLGQLAEHGHTLTGLFSPRVDVKIWTSALIFRA
jgi:hypothetical protein